MSKGTFRSAGIFYKTINKAEVVHFCWRRRMIKAKPRIATASRALIHRGDSTHTHGQVIYPVSLRPINKTVRRPGKPIPEEEEEELLDMVVSLIICSGH